MLKECKTSKCQNKLQQLQWKEQEKMGRPHKRLWDKVGEDSNKMGIKDRKAMVRDNWGWRKIVLVTKVNERQKCLMRRRQQCYQLQSVSCEWLSSVYSSSEKYIFWCYVEKLTCSVKHGWAGSSARNGVGGSSQVNNTLPPIPASSKWFTIMPWQQPSE